FATRCRRSAWNLTKPRSSRSRSCRQYERHAPHPSPLPASGETEGPADPRIKSGEEGEEQDSGTLPDLDDVLCEDHLLAADPPGIVGRGQITGEYPDAVRRVRDDLGDGAALEHDPRTRRERADIDRLAHSAAARSARRQVASSSQLSASINSAQRR